MDGKIQNVQYLGGCNGNLKAISKLVDGLTVEESLFWKSLESGARKGFSFSPLRYNQASSMYPIKHKKWNQEERASAADQKTYFLSERTFQYEFKLSNLRNSKINALAKTCVS